MSHFLSSGRFPPIRKLNTAELPIFINKESKDDGFCEVWTLDRARVTTSGQ